MFLGRRKPYPGSLLSPSSWRETLAKCVVQPHGGTSRRQGSQNTLPEANAARPDPQRKKNGKHPLLGRVCLLTTGGLIRVGWSLLTTSHDAIERIKRADSRLQP